MIDVVISVVLFTCQNSCELTTIELYLATPGKLDCPGESPLVPPCKEMQHAFASSFRRGPVRPEHSGRRPDLDPMPMPSTPMVMPATVMSSATPMTMTLLAA